MILGITSNNIDKLQNTAASIIAVNPNDALKLINSIPLKALYLDADSYWSSFHNTQSILQQLLHVDMNYPPSITLVEPEAVSIKEYFLLAQILIQHGYSSINGEDFTYPECTVNSDGHSAEVQEQE